MPSRWDPIIVRLLFVVCAVVIIGTAGFTWIEGWSPWKSLFFTLVTLTTVGYGDYGLSSHGEKFAAVLLVGGIATVSFTLSQVLQRVMTKVAHPELRMIDKARLLKGHVVVCGLGRTGKRIIDRLTDAGMTVTAIDNNETLVQDAQNRGIIAIRGDATNDETLYKAGLDNAASIAAVTSSDAVNAMICLSAHAIAPDVNIVARAEDESAICKLQRAGAHEVLSPATYGGDGIAQQILHPQVASLMPGIHSSNELLSFTEYVIEDDTTIAQLGAVYPRLVFIASRGIDGSVTLRPRGDKRLRTGEVLIIAGDPSDVNTLHINCRAAA
jgi:voltage-gated potassium channel